MAIKKRNSRSLNQLTYEKIEHLQEIDNVMAASHAEVEIDEDAPLFKKTNNKETLKKLLELEQEIFKRARSLGVID